MAEKKQKTEKKEFKPMGRRRKEGERHNVTMSWPDEFRDLVDRTARAQEITRTDLIMRIVKKELGSGKGAMPHGA
jgi:hypothetical protein